MSFLGRTKIAIARVIMQESGSYNPMYFRPYQTSHITPQLQETVAQRLEYSNTNQPGGAMNINGSLFSGIASQIVAPSANPHGNINIPNGWSERRIRFIMEIHATLEGGATQIYYLQGFTNYIGVGNSGAVDPRMEFIVNSFVRVTRSQQYTPVGLMPLDTVTQQAQIINGQIINQNIPGQQYFTMRPGDVFCGIQGAYLQNSTGVNTLVDHRVAIGQDAKTSRRSNNVASEYLAKIVNTYSTGQQLSTFGSNDNDILSRAIDNAYEESPEENPFFRLITSNRGYNIAPSTVFTFSELEKIDPTVSSRTNLLRMGGTMVTATGPMNFNNHQVGQSAYWNSATRETQVATILSNSIPALMMELMISRIWFESTNGLPGGQTQTVLKHAKSLTDADCRHYYELFKQRLASEVMFDVTYGNQEIYSLDMCVDLFGETTITLSLGCQPSVTYTTPSFCDGLMAPIINDDVNGFFGLAHDIDQLCNSTAISALETTFPTYNSSI